MIYIGIDPATKCGWAVLGENSVRAGGGTWNLERRKGDGAGMIYVRFERLFREVLDAWWKDQLVVAYEQQANRFAGSAHVGLGIIASIQRICEELQIPYTGVTFSTVKKHATGSGRASKDDMIQEAQRKWGLSGIDDNEADALWIADTAREGLA